MAKNESSVFRHVGIACCVVEVVRIMKRHKGYLRIISAGISCGSDFVSLLMNVNSRKSKRRLTSCMRLALLLRC